MRSSSVSPSVALLFAGASSMKPFGAATVAVLTIVPVTPGLMVPRGGDQELAAGRQPDLLVDQVADAVRAVETGRAERQAEALPFDVLERAREDVGDQGAADAARPVVGHHDVVADGLARGDRAVAVGVALDEGERAGAGERAAVPVAVEGDDGVVVGSRRHRDAARPGWRAGRPARPGRRLPPGPAGPRCSRSGRR